ncbi:hypothetical protein GCM10023212_18050 [Luteolibacter yonseiensis]
MNVAADAQTAGQTITLSPGWNAVWLEVEPFDADGQKKTPEAVFDDPSIEAVTSPKPLAGLSEFFAGEPGSVTSFNEDEWQQWKRNDPAGISNLSLITGNRPYLVKVADGAPVVLSLTGKVGFYRPEWTPDRYNLVGFGLQGTPSFDAFFGPSGTKHPVARIFTLNAATGNWEKVAGGAQMASGKAYWVFSSGQSSYTGPVSVEFDHSAIGRLDFGGPADTLVVGTGTDAMDLDLEEIVFSNAGPVAATPELDLITPDAGSGNLSLYVVNPAAGTVGYGRGNQVDTAPGAGASAPLGKTIASKQNGILTIGARRNWNDNSPRTNVYRLKTGANGASFWLPVTAVPSEIPLPPAGTPGTPADTVTGLWVGEVVFDSVTSIVEDGAPVRPASGKAPMRIIVHSDGSGTVRLLSQVTIMQTKTADAEIAAESVLVVDQTKIPFFEGVKERDGKRVGLRVEAVAYDMPRKLDGESQGNLIEDPKFLTLTTLSSALQAALSEAPINRTAAQNSLIASSSSAIAAAKQKIPTLLPNYLLSSVGRPPKLAEAYDLTTPMTGAVGAGQTLTGNLTLDPFHRSNPFRHAYHRDLAKGQQVKRTFKVTFDADQPITGRLRGTCTETLSGLIQSNLTLSGRVEFSRVSAVDSLQ